MSIVEIIEELPRLTVDERRELARRLHFLETGWNEVEMCDFLADEAMQLLDHEEEDAERSAQR